MAMSRHFVFAAFVLMACQRVSLADGQAARESDPGPKWIARITTDLFKIEEEEEDRESAVTMAAFALATAGEDDRAIEVTRRLLPPEKRKGALLGIACVLSQGGRLEEALGTVAECPTDDDRQFALAIVAIQQAQRGEVEGAIELLPKVEKGSHRERVLAAIAEAQAKAGEVRLARDTAKRIADGKRRGRALERVNNAGQEDPISKLRSTFLRQQIAAILLFSGKDSQRDAIRAIAAAEENDRSALTRHMNAALAESEGNAPLQRSTTHTLLAVALAEVGDREEARQMVLRSRKAESKEWLGVSSIFGSPILVSVLVRLDMNRELEALMDSLRESNTIAGPIAYHSDLHAIGATCAELERLDQADEYYDQLESPLERVHFAAGVLSYLR